ncbi:DNA ligase I [Thelephora terrestris]|uniref:DNA ligase n=1 Tax=Thelephora terrestris TaxID=56493 RepID=A0A9P6HHH0_9AGAM|nr:DNA ligase I [Thelephora terrestris]
MFRVLARTHRCMTRQLTLGRFFDMPKGTKSAPPQQANLNEFWGKPRPKSKKAEESPVASGSALKKEDAVDMEVDKPSHRDPKTEVASSPPHEPASPKSKKRRVDSDDEEDNTPDAVLRSSPPAKLKSKLKDITLEESKPKSKRRRVLESESEEDEPPAPTTKKSAKKGPPKKRTAEKANDAIASTSRTKAKKKDLEEDGDSKSATASENEDPADDEQGESELEEDAAAASKSASSALSKVEEVDIEGGWKVGDKVPYAALAKVFALIEATTKRLEKTALLTSFLLLVIRRSSPSDFQPLLQAVYLCINRLSPDYEGIELGIGESLLIKAITDSTGRSGAQVKTDLKKEGDLGLVAMNSKNGQKVLFKPKPLTLDLVFKNLKEIAMSSGHSVQKKKTSIITKLLAACQGMEAKYIIRSLEGKLRIGNAEKSVLVSLAHAVVLAEKEKAGKRWSQEKLTEKLEEGSSILKSVYSELPSYDLVIPALLKFGIGGLRERCQLTPGVPLKPMLAKPTKAIGEVLDRFEDKKFTCEYKYDGERAQVHLLPDGTIKVFSRNSEDMSKKYPDLMEQVPHSIKEGTKSFVLDAEAVAINKDTAKLMPFQELSRRKRKDVKVEDIVVRVCLFGFDLLYLNGESLLQKPLSERRKLLREHFQEVHLEFAFAKWSDAEAVEEIQTFLDESVKDGCEGLMVKMLDSDASHYEPSRRSVNWLKVKKDYLAGVGDSLDLVVVGGYYGKGKRTNVYGAFLLACYDAEAETYQTICKIGTGFSEEMLKSHWETLHPLETEKPRGDISVGGAKPDIWFEPKVVWEVLTADLSLSPIYTAAQGVVDERGISLRFPRFIRIRDDKNADDGTGPEQIAEMYESQALAQGGGKKKGGDDDGDFW